MMKKQLLILSILAVFACDRSEKTNPAYDDVPSIWSTEFYQTLEVEEELVFENIEEPSKRATFRVVDKEIVEINLPCGDTELTDSGACPNTAISNHLLVLESSGSELDLPDSARFSINLSESNSGEFREISIISADFTLALLVNLKDLKAKNISENNAYAFETLLEEGGIKETQITYTYKPLSKEGKPVFVTYGTERGILEMGVTHGFFDEDNRRVERYSRFRRVFD